MTVIKLHKNYVVWEFCDGGIYYAEVEAHEPQHLAEYIKNRLVEKTQEAPTDDELALIETKPVIVFSKRSEYWMLVYKEGQAFCLQQMDELVN